MKMTLMGHMAVPQEITPHLTLEEAISFRCLTDDENQLLRDNFVKKYYERPTLVYDPLYFFNFLRTTCDTQEQNVAMLKKTFSVEYNPIENYDRYEESQTFTSGSSNSTNFSKGSNTSTGTSNSDSYSSGTSESAHTNKISAFDTKVMATHDTQDTSDSGRSVGANRNTEEGYGTSNTMSSNSSGTSADEKHISHIHGNIGVTTSTQMQNEIIDLYTQKGFYDIVCEMIMTKSECFYYLFN